MSRRQPIEAVSIATCTEAIALTANTESFIPFDYFYVNQGLYYNVENSYWVCMSRGTYNISMTMSTSINVTSLLLRMYIGTSPTSVPGIGYMIIPVGNGVARNIHSVGFSTTYQLEEGWTFRFSIAPPVDCSFGFRNFNLVQYPTPVVSITQIAGGYDIPTNVNDWYYEPNEIEPR
jgi:hypothetical protein